ncbi:isoleucine--tRNA ligase, cytoplasmic-like isoform X2 [Dysidea avara]|uniref:isoleucine--tRNA ligase, cytoplasmic-like isoform X2 n=1 Tax=Dysidea avara TaxID=196820 RepID=UPI00331F3DE6
MRRFTVLPYWRVCFGQLVKRKMSSYVPDQINFPKEEEKTLKLWKELDAFQTSLKQSKDRPRYTFYDGPPFATGLPHYGHILAGTIKDTVTRYAHQTGHHVERRFGWDCHGLPVEYEIDKTLGIKGPEDVKAMGIGEYNKECRKIVMRYSTEWKEIVTRLGRWIDFDNDYKTLYPWFMESIWWVFKQLYDKGLVYRGYKVMPYSTGCNTPLSNFESGQNYKDAVDPAVIVNFPLDDDPNVSVIAWTTTPWTLPSNLALCVHPDFTYVKVKDQSNNSIYIMLEDRLEALFKNPEEYAILERFKGISLLNKKYQPLFSYFAHMKQSGGDQGAFRILCDTYVTSDSGTGVVHQAPGFGEDDFRVCTHYGVIRKDEQVVCPVDETGCFTSQVTDFKGQYVKSADKGIMKVLKQNGRLVHQSTMKHSYPFCWRSETPLIYKAVPSWFVRVESIVDKLLKNNQKCYWVPEFVKDKRFHNWLKDACDWAISHNRYWGTPIPLWVSDDLQEVVCVGSIAELEELSGVKVTDLHREKDGQKMSKRLKNYPDPVEVVNKYGADALRLYLINSPVVRAEVLKFKEDGVRDVVKDVFLPWYNAYRFLVQNVQRLETEEGISFKHDDTLTYTSTNLMDKWIVSFTQSLLSFVHEEMDRYRLYTVVPRLVRFIDQLTNWYVRFNRRRIKGETGQEECLQSLHTLYDVLYTMCRMMAPFTPFLTELMYQNLRQLLVASQNSGNASIHYLMMPRANMAVVDLEIEQSMASMQVVIELGRVIRDRKVLPVKYPLPEVVVIHRDQSVRDHVSSLKSYILEELTVKELVVETDEKPYNVQLKAQPNSERLGKRLKRELKKVSAAINAFTEDDIKELQSSGEMVVAGHTLTTEDIKLLYTVDTSQSSNYEAHSDGKMLVLLNCTPSDEMKQEGIAREVVNKIQKLRKKAGLKASDEASIVYSYVGNLKKAVELSNVISDYKDYITTATKGDISPGDAPGADVIAEDEQKIKGLEGASLKLWLVSKRQYHTTATSSGPPRCRYVNMSVLPGSSI